jgi:hypothetical protein
MPKMKDRIWEKRKFFLELAQRENNSTLGHALLYGGVFEEEPQIQEAARQLGLNEKDSRDREALLSILARIVFPSTGSALNPPRGRGRPRKAITAAPSSVEAKPEPPKRGRPRQIWFVRQVYAILAERCPDLTRRDWPEEEAKTASGTDIAARLREKHPDCPDVVWPKPRLGDDPLVRKCNRILQRLREDIPLWKVPGINS